MDKLFNKLLIIDGSYCIHRSLHVPELFTLRTSTGIRTGGIFGFIRSIISEFKNCGNYFPVVTWDSGLSPRRVSVDPHYKLADKRSGEVSPYLDDEYIIQYNEQRSKLIELLSYFGVPSIKFKNWEGDDLMYILRNISKESLILTDDKDLLQLLSCNCNVRRPMAKENWTLDSFLSSKGLKDIYDFVIYKAIMGDGSDNIPKSCKGVGEKSVNNFIELLTTKFHPGPYKMCFDFSGYPKNQVEMKELCNELGIKYSKAYLNFDESRFCKNLNLVDLNLVDQDIDDRLIESIVTSVQNCRLTVDYFKAIKLLSELEIREFSADNFMQLVSSRYNSLMGD